MSSFGNTLLRKNKLDLVFTGEQAKGQMGRFIDAGDWKSRTWREQRGDHQRRPGASHSLQSRGRGENVVLEKRDPGACRSCALS